MLSLKQIKQSPEIRKYLPWAMVLTVLGIGYPWFFRPIQQALSASCQVNHIESMYQERMDRLSRIVTKQRLGAKQLAAWKEIRKDQIFSTSEADSFFLNLDQQAASFGCHIRATEFEILDAPGHDAEDTPSPIHLQSAEIELIGMYNQWIRFLEWIESLPQHVLIYSLHIESRKDRPGFLNGRIEMAIPVLTEESHSESEASFANIGE